MSSSLRVLAVCTHNRTRSVLIGGLLQELAKNGQLRAAIRTTGFSEGGKPPTDPTIRFLANRGIDVKGYLSNRMNDNVIAEADLIVTAEHHQVIEIAGRWPGSFERTFTLPEIVERGEANGPGDDRTFHDWLAAVNQGRPNQMDYLDAPIGEIADPTGHAPAAWQACFTQLDDLTTRLAVLLDRPHCSNDT